MRILNRPMFKYGGPIKEGVMHGMQDGGRIGFQDGTKKKIFGVEIPGTGIALDPATGSPYDPKYIQEMMKKERDKMTNVMSWMFPGMRAIKGAGWSYKLGKPAIKKLFQGPVSQSKELTKYAGPVIRGSDKWFGNIFRPAYQGVKQGAKNALAPLKNFKTAIGLGIPAGGYGLAKGYEAWKKRQGTDVPDPLDPTTTTETTSRWDDTAPILTDSMRADLAKKQQNERLKSYLDMMGYDRSKKTAMSDALIDASALVQDATTEAGSIKEADWGKLINKAIQTTSKRLDKPEQIREAVGLMATKAEIEKDLEDPQVKELRALQIEKGKKDLKGLSIGELIPGISKGLGKTRVDAEVMKNVMSVKEPNIIATIVGKKEDLQDIKDASDFTTVEDYIVNEYKGKEGIYIIDNVVVQIDANGVPDRLY